LEGADDDNIFCIYICSEPKDEFFISSPNHNGLVIKQFFSFANGDITLLENSAGAEKINNQAASNSAPLYADTRDIAKCNFQVVVFCAGAYIYNTLPLEGITIKPIEKGLNNLPILEAIDKYLLENHTINIFANGKNGPWLETQPTFAVHFNHVVSASRESALAYTKRTIDYMRDILALDRGDRPYPFITLLLDRDTLNWALYPSTYDFRGNLLAPLFPHSNADQIERLRPVVEKNPFARLVLSLYVQTITEKDRSYKFFRQWSLLEMIAEKYIKTSSTPLKYKDGSIIYREPGKELTTKNNSGKVYSLLCSRSIAQSIQGFSDGTTVVIEGSDGGYNPGGKIISLYLAVAAAYAVRNAVAHEGFYDNLAEPKNEKQELSKMLYNGVYGFLEHWVASVALAEIYKDS
ncbi:hypothetical protein YA0796_20985, partial [Pseudomonas syringae]|uniref:hypothetical protein n=1 Tax=Pseudomonas syringae TaxID=317 RepID=UPI0018E61483